MDRQIKFRAYDKTRNEYLSAGKIFLTINNGKNPADSVMYLDILTSPNMYVDRFIIEQYTGLKDRNGKEIYEGDIVKACSQGEHRICEVAWSQKTVSFFLRHSAGVWALSGAWGNESCEVVGNIHDNPELISNRPTDD